MYPSLILSFLLPLNTLDFLVYYFFALSFIISLLRVLTLVYIFLNSVFTFVKQTSKHKLGRIKEKREYGHKDHRRNQARIYFSPSPKVIKPHLRISVRKFSNICLGTFKTYLSAIMLRQL